MIDRQNLLQQLFIAYYDARRHKRIKNTSLQFELSYESHLFSLYEELVAKTYKPWTTTCFIIHDPVQREIFTWAFRDRVVHHLIYNYIYDIFDTWFIHDAYSCRIGKWIHYGVQRVNHFIRSCSQNYTKECYVLKLDIKWFFMAIDKQILWELLVHRLQAMKEKLSVEYEWLLWVVHRVLFHNPLYDIHIQGNKNDWAWLPQDKSLFYSPQNKWLPIGNLTSQLFANVYLHPLDIYIKKTLQCRYYGRYVDDFLIVHHHKEYLLSCIPRIRDFLQKKLQLTLHPKKIYLQHYTKWVKFLGAYIKPFRIYPNRRTIGNFEKKILALQNKPENRDSMKVIGVINSYLGLVRHYKSYMIRKKIVKQLPKQVLQRIYFNKAYTKASPYSKKVKLKDLRMFISLYKYQYNALSRIASV